MVKNLFFNEPNAIPSVGQKNLSLGFVWAKRRPTIHFEGYKARQITAA